MKLYLSFQHMQFQLIIYSNDLIRSTANCIHLRDKKIMHVRIVSGHVLEEGQTVSIDQVFELIRLGRYVSVSGRTCHWQDEGSRNTTSSQFLKPLPDYE